MRSCDSCTRSREQFIYSSKWKEPNGKQPVFLSCFLFSQPFYRLSEGKSISLYTYIYHKAQKLYTLSSYFVDRQSVFYNETSVYLFGDILLQNSIAKSRGGMPEVHGGATEVHGGTTEVHGGATEVHGGTTEVHGGTTEVHGGATEVHGGATEVHGGATEVHGGATKVHDNLRKRHGGVIKRYIGITRQYNNRIPFCDYFKKLLETMLLLPKIQTEINSKIKYHLYSKINSLTVK
jgi:hypothetical protein